MAASAPKRSLFKQPSWASSAAPSTQVAEDAPIFGGNRIYEDIIEQEHKRRQRREAKAKARMGENKEEDNRLKRRRISEEAERQDSDSDAASKTSSLSGNSDSGRRRDSAAAPVTRSTPRKDKNLLDGLDEKSAKRWDSPKSRSALEGTISVDDDGDEFNSTGEQHHSLPNPSPVADGTNSPAKEKPAKKDEPFDSDENDEDDYLRELKQKAREKGRLVKQGLKVDKPATPNTAVAPNFRDIRSPSLEQPPLDDFPSPTLGSSTNLASVDDPEVSILIKSTIPETKALIVNRRASQNLGLVKDFWCARQGFDDRFSAQVFLAWRGSRLFSTTTVGAILRRLKKSDGGIDGQDPSNGRIHVEAMTEEIQQQRLKQRERKLELEAGLLDESDNDTENENENETNDDQPRLGNNSTASQADGTAASGSRSSNMSGGIIINLRCQSPPKNMSIRVRPNTSIEKIMLGFQKLMDIEKRCYLVFDGERLEPESTVQEVGFEDGDEVEVYPR